MRFNLGLTTLNGRDLALLSDLYDGEIAYLDRRVGEVIDLLKRRGLLDRTVIVVTSDHGESIGEHRLVDHKLNVYDNLLRIPLLLRYPAAVRPGQRVQDVVMLQDLFPTLLALAGIPLPARPATASVAEGEPAECALLPGVSAPGGEATGRGRGQEPIIAEFARPIQFLEVMQEVLKGADTRRWDRALVAYRVGDEKLHWSSDGRPLLFDLARDPGEEHDLAPSRPQRVAALSARVEAWLRRPAARPPLALSRPAD